MKPEIIRTCEPLACCDPIWEAAYLRFETAEEEIRKFDTRLRKLGADRWNKNDSIVEIFCGRGNGLLSLQNLGFQNIEGVDLSERLLLQFSGDAQLYVADCRKLPFESNSKDVIIVQGGLHHLPTLPDDLDATLHEAKRVLKPSGRFVMVEPWMTTFLRSVHFFSEIPILRKAWNKLDAFATMTEQENTTYYQWHRNKQVVLESLQRNFAKEILVVKFGKLFFSGSPKK